MTARKNIDQDPEMRRTERALVRAAHRAREIAYQTGTPIALFVDGKVVKRYITKEELSADTPG